jgi:hypothetical protein
MKPSELLQVVADYEGRVTYRAYKQGESLLVLSADKLAPEEREWRPVHVKSSWHDFKDGHLALDPFDFCDDDSIVTESDSTYTLESQRYHYQFRKR